MKRLFALLAVSSFAVAAGGYHLLNKIPVPGDGGFDYLTVDNGARRLYVSHGTQVEVLDADSGAIVGKIPNTKGVHGIAVAPDLGRGFTSNGQSSTVTIFDLKTLAPVGEVKTGKKPDAIIYDPATHRVFAFNGDSKSATVIEAADGKVAGTIELGGGPEFAASDGGGHVFVNLEDKSMTLNLNSREMKVEQRWPLAPCDGPSAMAMDQKSRRLFIGCGNKMMAVVNADSGKVVTTMPIGDRVDAAAFDPGTGLAFFSNGDGTLNVFHEDSADKYSAVETVKTQSGAKTLALDPKTHKIFLSAAERKGARGPIVPGSFTILVVGQ
jgi:DNA-binding beta-propeller fold protein YncE